MAGAVRCVSGRKWALRRSQIAGEIGPAGLTGLGAIDIEFASGARVRITGVVDPALVTATVAALADGRRR